ncbi:uncharacterized protein DUF1801 [Ulvibacter sp. MAR_2010_11]|uniref:DUF1801 domain-containing protein n=1 Tax=Ulvibacter sp. MAR_2010_11 TaxID=1250229 RepID=UPI000C2BEC3D|nr:DUF1801 domain-containing protein [Ulvibacter sp. MAR_2010_11]PKA82031.1 uncharacterized protein DUF1801 [Ulvibacter sp. MAR_2010_11]
MAKNKTTEREADISEFINSFVDNEQKKTDSYELIKLMSKWSGCDPKMWGPTIIGFGSYHYKYASGHEGDAPLIAFSPRKAQFSLYVHSNTEKSKLLLENLGKCKISKACIYVKKLADIDISVLEKLSLETFAYLEEHNECSCRH